MRAVALISLVAIGAALSGHTADSVLRPSDMAGRYSYQFPNAFASGETYTSENLLEIVALDASRAYVRTRLAYANGHSCGIDGIARVEGGALVYRASERPYKEQQSCVLKVSRLGDKVLVDDGEGSCRSFCGARGTLSDVTFPAKSRRPIRYMARLKASEELKAALEEERRR